GHRRSAARGERAQRGHAPDVHSLDREPGRRRPGAAGEGDPGLPGYRQAHPAGQRSLLTAPKRENVELVRDEIDHSEGGGGGGHIVTVGGERYEADIIVYATGFYTNRMLWPMNINGR